MKGCGFMSYTQNQLLIKSLIKHGKENAISRNELARLSGLSDRKVRSIINELRCLDLVICSSSQHNGYWYPTKRQEVVEFQIEMNNRMRNERKMVNSANKYLKVHGDQMKF